MPRLRLLPPVTVANTPEEAVPILRYLMKRGGPLAIDTETDGLKLLKSTVLFWSMATESTRYFFPWELLEIFAPLFARVDVEWYLANAKFDMHMLCNRGVRLAGRKRDIIVMDAMDDDTRDHGLKEQAKHAYEVGWGEFKNLFLDPAVLKDTVQLDPASVVAFKRKDVGDKLLYVYDEAPWLVEDYASCDAFFTYMLGEDLSARLAATPLPTAMFDGFETLLDYFEVIEMPLTDNLWEMERNGIAVDIEYVKSIDRPMRDGIHAAEMKLLQAAGRTFNPKSSGDLQDILFGPKGFGMKPISYTPGGKTAPAPKTDEKTLKRLMMRVEPGRPEYRFIKALLDYRGLIKLHGTYVKGFLNPDSDKYHLGPDGRVHCRLNQTGARTSRLSSANPNMQNIPIRNDPFKIRGCFTADPGELLVDLDYPQIEFRIAAVLAGEEKMMDAIRAGWDIHTANATNMYPDASYDAIVEARHRKDNKLDLSPIHRKMLLYRDGAKTVGLGTLYGEGARKMAGQLEISHDEALDLIDTFFKTYPNIKSLIAHMHDYAHETETTHTMLGRMRQMYRINGHNPGIEAEEERQAFNTLIQGSGAEMMKLAILRVGSSKEFRELGGKLALTVHDELISRAPRDTAKDVFEVKKKLMSDPFRVGPIQYEYPVPITPDGSVAFRWSEAK